MSSNPTSFRMPFESQIAALPPEHQVVIRTQWNAILDLQTAVPLLKTQIDANTTAVAAAAAVNTTSSSETVVTTISTIGMVNNQTGATTYATAQSDYGAFIVLDSASAVAVTLTAGPVITIPFFCSILNLGAGLVTATPASGTISFPGSISAGSMTVPQNFGAAVWFDGSNFWAFLFPVSPQNTPAITSEWLNSYDSSTGVFGQSQPAIADISGLSAALALLAPLNSPALTGTPTAPTAAPGADDTQIATTAYTDAAVLVEKTRAETAEALLAPIASPTFTGTVTQPDSTVLTDATTATSATAGVASALPATPALYLEISINGTVYNVPAFNV